MLSVLVLFSLALAVFSVSNFSYPSFSWSTLPVYIQTCNQSGNFNATTIEYITRYSFIVIEKGQGENGTTEGYYAEDYMIQAAKSIKEVSPTTGVYFYWNSVLDWPQYYMHQIFLNNSQWWMRNTSNGVMYFEGDKTFPYHNNLLGFDLSQQDCADWWASGCYNMTKTGYFDGCNPDRAMELTYPNIPNDFEIKKQQYYYNRKLNLFRSIQKHLNETDGFGPLFLNWIFAYKLEGVMGMTIEQFAANEENILLLVTANYYRYNNPGNMAIKIHGGNHNPCSNHTQFINVMSAFLMGAEIYTWFTCNDEDYFLIGNPLWYPEYDEPLGEPKGVAYKINDTYYREFESGTAVTFNTTTNMGNILWGRKYHFNTDNMPSYIQQLRAHKSTHGISVLDIVNLL